MSGWAEEAGGGSAPVDARPPARPPRGGGRGRAPAALSVHVSVLLHAGIQLLNRQAAAHLIGLLV